jgi:hypothetical protein
VQVQNDQYGVSHAQLAVIGIKAIQEQQAMINQLREKIEKIKSLRQPKETTITTTSSN